MDIPAKYFEKFGVANASKKQLEEYPLLVKDCAKVVGQTWYPFHARVERLFEGKELRLVLSNLNEWYFEATKQTKIPAGMLLNAKMKQYKAKLTHKP